MKTSIIQFLQDCYPFGYPLLLCSIGLIAAILFHLLSTRRARITRDLPALWLETKRGKEDARQALLQNCHRDSSALAKEVLFLSENKNDSSEELHRQLETRLSLYMDGRTSGLSTISLIVNIAPMLGILGTAWGLVDIFAVFGSENSQVGITMGISKALYTTIFGLAIAIPGMIALSSFERKLERQAAQIGALFADILANRKKL